MEDKQRKAAALNYQSGAAAVPRITAKGSGAVADKIIEIAKAHGVPIKEDKQLVDILSALDLYQEIPQELYKAVAEILAFIYKLSKKPAPASPPPQWPV
ncbi:EscU/YscU/HrcU family type III secretion system export apparatus switch protein [Candidatus Magnetominusculus xianensis]|uniref:Flagellar biosynthetic protein FlhB n=1 Tax=Candidatus Magnetominusculus xianensis TaxID=1748249 RepID=A0ABR5SF57_9BACT|nr:EscU/YscU/HrcU family type III secretion system export apparatus switch protein [Candidatus Magnetominusculus xianensis]KWT85377.1 flagellar biosynthetic protein FlhB [Candidatus Magnetominusculus xianensis]MBF0405144.1 EscU/YscU/HrcU family type III secretion system export apparatus switch protein [Nitrospirota bacterium]